MQKIKDIDWNTDFWNFGQVKENSILEFSFVYYGVSPIKKIESGCGCTIVSRTKNKIEIKVNTGKVINKKDWKVKRVSLDVITEDGMTHHLQIKAIVKKDELYKDRN